MTVSTTNARVTYTGDGGTVAFPVTFSFFATTDLVVIERVIATGVETTKTITTHYTVTGGDGSTGTVTAVSAPASTVQWIIKRVLPRTQAIDFVPNAAFPANTAETGYDRAVMLIQELDEVDTRALKFPTTDSSSLSATLPSSVDRASKYLAFGPTGLPIATAGTSSDVVASAFGETIIAAADLAAAQAILGIGTTAVASDAEALTGTDNAKILSIAVAGGWLGRALTPGGRVTLTTALPVTVADVTAAGTIYLSPREHNLYPLWNGTRWQVVKSDEISLALDSDSGHTGYHQSGKKFDVFLFDNSGLALGTGPAWTNDTTRADAIGRKDGRWTNNGSIVLRYGTAAGSTATVAANKAFYLGTFEASANGQTEDSFANRFLWNTYHRVPRPMRSALETANSWNYTIATVRQANANTANKLNFVRGLDEDEVTAEVHVSVANTNVSVIVAIGIGLDVTDAFSTGSRCAPQVTISSSASVFVPMFAKWRGFPGIGRHFLSWNEYSTATGTTTWFGDNNNPTLCQAGIHGTMMG